MRIAIRMDDITADMDHAKFERFKKILDEHGVKPLIGVVPFNQDEKLKKCEAREDFWDYCRKLQDSGWVIAMHGFNHLYTTKEAGLFPIGNKSEFAGLPFSRQDEMIREGKRLLKQNGIVTDIFMAPSHSFDRNTLKALKVNGFKKVTDGFGISPFVRNDLIFYPISTRRSSTLSDKRDGITTFVYHANTMDDKDFEAFEKLFDVAQVVSFSEFDSLKPVERGFIGDISEYLVARTKFTAVRLKKMIKR